MAAIQQTIAANKSLLKGIEPFSYFLNRNLSFIGKKAVSPSDCCITRNHLIKALLTIHGKLLEERKGNDLSRKFRSYIIRSILLTL